MWMVEGSGGTSIMKGFSEQVKQASLQNKVGIADPAVGQETALDDLLRFLLSLLFNVHIGFFLLKYEVKFHYKIPHQLFIL